MLSTTPCRQPNVQDAGVFYWTSDAFKPGSYHEFADSILQQHGFLMSTLSNAKVVLIFMVLLIFLCIYENFH